MKAITFARNALVAAAAALASLPAAAPALAHAEHGKAMHSGAVAEAGVFQGELVVKPGAVTLYLSDHGQPIPSQGASARMTVLAGGQKAELQLAPAGENRLAAVGPHPLGAGARAVASVKLADGRSGALRFELK